jgi:hypothetical protein
VQPDEDPAAAAGVLEKRTEPFRSEFRPGKPGKHCPRRLDTILRILGLAKRYSTGLNEKKWLVLNGPLTLVSRKPGHEKNRSDHKAFQA